MTDEFYIQVFKSEDKLTENVWMGIDQSLTGFAVCALDDQGNYHVEVLRPRNRGVQRLDEISRFLRQSYRRWNPHDVAMEGTVVQSTSASVLGELSGVMKLTLFNAGCLPMIVPPTTLKKFVTGQGNVAKSRMMMSALKRYGVEIPDDNAVDAYGLARIVRGTAITKVEEQIITKLSDPKFRE